MVTVGSKIIRGLEIFLWFDCQFLSSDDCYKWYEAERLRLAKYLYHKTALRMSFFHTNYLKCWNNFAADYKCCPFEEEAFLIMIFFSRVTMIVFYYV